jgi:serine/threonine protein phosphatase PrpC
MSSLTITIGQWSDKGQKPVNQDFHGAVLPEGTVLTLKGAAIALADGISGSAVSHVASETAVRSFLSDYYCTSDTWSVRTSAQRVIAATNAWLHGRNRRGPYRHETGTGFVCTFTALVAKGRWAHIFHIGDARVSRLSGGTLEPLTEEHRVRLSSAEIHLGRALGVNPDVEIDHRSVPLNRGDCFVLTTDGVHDHLAPSAIAAAIDANPDDLDRAAQAIARAAFDAGSPDNLTVQIARIDALPDREDATPTDAGLSLPPPPPLRPRMTFDGYRIVRQLHASNRCHVWLASDLDSGDLVAIKVPSTEAQADPAALRRFAMEDWIAARIDNAHVVRPKPNPRGRGWLYLSMEYVEGRTLTQWMIDNPMPDIETVRAIVEQIARGLQAFHRKDMLHRDLRPDNILIDGTGTVKIVDFGAVRISGLAEAGPTPDGGPILGTVQYTAPETLADGRCDERSDQFSLGVIAYQMLTGRLPYGPDMARGSGRGRRRRHPAYIPATSAGRDIPAWIDGALRRAVHPDPARRHEALSSLLFDLRHPNPAFNGAAPVPLLTRDPVRTWQGVSFVLACLALWLAVSR